MSEALMTTLEMNSRDFRKVNDILHSRLRSSIDLKHQGRASWSSSLHSLRRHPSPSRVLEMQSDRAEENTVGSTPMYPQTSLLSLFSPSIKDHNIYMIDQGHFDEPSGDSRKTIPRHGEGNNNEPNHVQHQGKNPKFYETIYWPEITRGKKEQKRFHSGGGQPRRKLEKEEAGKAFIPTPSLREDRWRYSRKTSSLHEHETCRRQPQVTHARHTRNTDENETGREVESKEREHEQSRQHAKRRADDMVTYERERRSDPGLKSVKRMLWGCLFEVKEATFKIICVISLSDTVRGCCGKTHSSNGVDDDHDEEEEEKTTPQRSIQQARPTPLRRKHPRPRL